MIESERNRVGGAAVMALLRDPAVLRLWSAGAVIQCGRWLDILAFGLLIFEWTGSPLTVTAILFTRMLPLLFFGSIAGTLADRIDRRRMLIISLILISGLYTLSGWWSIDGGPYPGLAFALSIAGGLFWSAELPMRRGLLAEVAGMERVGTSMGMELLTANVTRMVGPAIGGALVALLGFSGVMWAGTVLHLLALMAIMGLPKRLGSASPAAEPLRIFAPLHEGWQHVRATPVLIGTVMVTAAINLWGFPYVSLVPVIAHEVMDLGPVATGLLVASEGAGAFLASLFITMMAPPSLFRRIYSLGTLLFLASVVLFGFATDPWIGALSLTLAGVGMAGFNTMQIVLMLQGAAPALRGRSLGILVGAMGLAPFGFLQFGLAATWIGASLAAAVVAAVGFAAVLACVLRWPTLMQAGQVHPAQLR